jgi:hypothetical protein
VTGGAGAHPYVVERSKGDLFQSQEVNYHYLMVEVDSGVAKITMHRLDLTSGTAVWTQPDSITISVPPAKAAAQSQQKWQTEYRAGSRSLFFEDSYCVL